RRDFPCGCAEQATVSVEQSTTGEFDCLGYRCQGNAPAPPLVADELPGVSVRYVIQYLPDHNTGAFEGGFTMADQRIGHDELSEFNYVLLVIDFGFHAVVGGLCACHYDLASGLK